MAGHIRDPLHGYIPITLIERMILEDRLAQRLRAIGQSAAAQLVFPSMTVTRFSHSLGAMHLVSRMFRAALTNADEVTRQHMVDGFVALVRDQDSTLIGRDDDRDQSRERVFRGEGLEGLPGLFKPTERLATIIVEQSLRLVSLLHDLGHLPFSHDFEDALARFFVQYPDRRKHLPNLAAAVEANEKLHEIIGYRLADWVQDELLGTADTKVSPESLLVTRCAVSLAQKIFHSEEDVANPLGPITRWLYGLVSGEVDADRCDYILRDARHYGLDGASYDLDRLIGNLVVIRTDDGGRLETMILDRGTTAGEEFLIARVRMYQWAIYHHKIQQAAAGLRFVLRHELAGSDEYIGAFMEDLETLVGTKPGDPKAMRPVFARFADYTDGWWIEHLKRRLGNAEWCEANPLPARWAALFVYRDPGPFSLWKTATEITGDDRTALNSLTAEDWQAGGSIADAVRHLEEAGILVAALHFKPWKARAGETPQVSRLRIWNRKTATAEPLSTISSLVAGLDAAWDESVHVLAFSAGAPWADRAARAELAESTVAALTSAANSSSSSSPSTTPTEAT
jgi:HD superfamily phosphohydrolase